MRVDPRDTIVALASAPGAGGRAILRLSGPGAVSVVRDGLHVSMDIDERLRRRYSMDGRLRDLERTMPVELYVFPESRSFTGQLMTEIHVSSSPPLVELLIAQLLVAGARAAEPGEFTLRAFLGGRVDLPRAEAIFATIAARDRNELCEALTQLSGGMMQPLHALRSDLLDLLADLEAGLDFAEEDITFLDSKNLLDRIAKGLAILTILQRQLQQRALHQRPFRVLLTGRPNAGKSSLFNALTKAETALVSDIPGTTRDYLARVIDVEGVPIELIDTAGQRATADVIESKAQELAGHMSVHADLVVWCREVSDGGDVPAGTELVATKCDLTAAEWEPNRSTSARTGAGLDALRSWFAERASAQSVSALAPSWSRCRHHVQTCLIHLRKAHGHAMHEEPAEVLAMEVRAAIDQLGEMVGAVYTDDLLDRIFSRFCIGK